MTYRTIRKHRSAADWQTLIHHWQQSGLSAPAFCLQNQIGYASFCNWRKRLNGPTIHNHAEVSPQNDFIDLSGLSAERQEMSWHLWLRLGSLVELRIGRR